MVLLAIDSFEADRTSASLARRYTASGWPSTLDAGVGRKGGQALILRQVSGGPATIEQALAPADELLLLGFGFKANKPEPATTIFEVKRGGAAQLWIAYTSVTGTGYTIGLYGAGGTLLYDSGLIRNSVWIYIELKAVVSVAANLGEYELHIDGIDVANGSANLADTGASGWDSLKWTFTPDTAVSGSFVAIDDLYITDGATGYARSRFFGPGVLAEMSRPITDGHASMWDVTGAGTNQDAVDDAGAGTVDDDTTYVSTNDENALDLYEYTHLIGTQFGIVGVELEADARHEGVTLDYRPVAYREGRAVEIAKTPIPDSAYSRIRYPLEKDPTKEGTPGGFTYERLGASEFGHGDPTAITQAPPKQNVVLFFVDDPTLDALLQFDAINPYQEDWTAGNGGLPGGGDNPFTSGIYAQTPFLSMMAQNGITFTDCHANPTCSPSRACLITGNYSFRHGVGSIIRDNMCTIGEFYEFGDFAVTTLVDILNAASITTAHVGKWHLCLDTGEDTDPPSGYSGQGWDHLPDVGHWSSWSAGPLRNPAQTPTPDIPAKGNYYQWRRNWDGILHDYTDPDNEGWTNPNVARNYIATVQLERAAELAKTLTEPFYLNVWCTSVHGPFTQAPPNLVATEAYKDFSWPGTGWANALGMVEALDRKMMDFWEALPSSLKKRTNFIIVGDNGTDAAVASALASHFDMGPTYDALMGIGRFKGQVYERGTAVPLIIAGPAVSNGGRVSEAMVHVVDIMPTVCELFGLPKPDGIDGVSLLPIIKNTTNHIGHERQAIFIEAFAPNGHPLETYAWPANWSSASVSYALNALVAHNDGEWKCIQAHVSNSSREPGTSGGDAYWSYQRGLRLDRSIKARLSGFTTPSDGTANGVFKLVIIKNQAMELYRIRDDGYARMDPYELNPLSLSTYAAQVAYLLALIQEILTGGGDGALQLPVVRDSGGVDLPCSLNEADQLPIQLDTSGGSLLVDSAAEQVTVYRDTIPDTVLIDLIGGGGGGGTSDLTLNVYIDSSGGTKQCDTNPTTGGVSIALDSGGSLEVDNNGSDQIAVTIDTTAGTRLVDLTPI